MSTAEEERAMLNHYGLTTLNPRKWPSEDAKETPATRAADGSDKFHRRQTILGGAQAIRQKQKKTRGPIPQDEQDPLGASDGVVSTLKFRGLRVDDDLELRNQFLLSSTSFSPSRYLEEVHGDASTDQLLRGLDFLSRSIEQKSASLKVLVESNFERFVRAKSTIDSVYKEMRDHGTVPEPDRRNSHRQSMRSQMHFRTGSGALQQQSAQAAKILSDKRKYAVIKESEYGTLAFKIPLIDAAVQAEEIWGPALGSRDRGEGIKAAVKSMDESKDLINATNEIDECAKRNDYNGVLEHYGVLQKRVHAAKKLAEKADNDAMQLSEVDLHNIVITARIWMDVQSKLSQLRQGIWTKLLSSRATGKDDYMELISLLMQLGADENPITAWLQSQHDQLKHKITTTFEKSRVELEILRRRLSTRGPPSSKTLAAFLKTATVADKHASDAEPVLQFWAKIKSAVDALLSTKNGLLGEIVELWDTTRAFVDGKKQKSLPLGIDGQSRRFHKLSAGEVAQTQQNASSLLGLIHRQMYGLFLEEPVEDVSLLLSPIPPTPHTPATPSTRFNISENVPPSSKTGESWEKLAFWPPHGNSLTASIHLGKLANAIAAAVTEMALLPNYGDEEQTAQLRSLLSEIRERFNTATCAAWVVDSENCRDLEDWTRSAEKPEVTNMPTYFYDWESTMLSNLQKIVYVSDAGGRSHASRVIVPPSQRHVETVQRAFRNSLYKAFDGMMQYARKPVVDNGLVVDGASSFGAVSTVLLTISNLQHLRHSLVPNLVIAFESSFSLTITNDARTLRDALSQMSSQVFKALVKPTLAAIDATINAGVADPHYTTSTKPDNARPYVYSVLATLVTLHTEISSATPGLTSQILAHCLEHISATLLAAFAAKPAPFALFHLMQITLDVEFLAQTLSSYTTATVTEVQGQIYAKMDEKSDNDARVALQAELTAMRDVLKRLRASNRATYSGLRRSGREGAGRDARKRDGQE